MHRRNQNGRSTTAIKIEPLKPITIKDDKKYIAKKLGVINE